MIYDICSAYILKYSNLVLPFIISCYKQMEINTGAVSSVGRVSKIFSYICHNFQFLKTKFFW